MSPADLERAGTWITEIVETILEGVTWRREGDEYRASGHGGLTINAQRGCWYQHSSGKGGWSVISLVVLLKGCGDVAAAGWVEAFLRAHPGTGSTTLSDGDDEREVESAAIAQEILDKLVDPIGTPAETYLRSRGLTVALPDFIRYLSHARCGEGAIVGLLKAHDRVVGLQLGYLDPDGRKTTVPPCRRRFMLERIPDAVFEVPKPNGAANSIADLVVVEGLEDLLSLAELGLLARLVGLPGIGTLRHLSVKKGERVVVVRDGDAPGSAADEALTAGTDHLLLQGASVSVTATPAGQDANDVLQNGGTAALEALIASAAPTTLSPNGEIIRLSTLETLAYDQERKEAAERLGVRVSTLDKAVAKKRATEHASDQGSGDDTAGQGRPIELPVIEPWPEPVDGAALFNDIAAGIKKYLILEEYQITATALWVVFSHAFNAFEVAPKLVLKSAQKRSGKTRTLEVLTRLVARPLETSGISAAALLRVMERCGPTLLLDEFDTMMRGNAELVETLRGILNSGFNRALARIIKSVPVPGGGWEEREFSTWCPQVLAGIGSLPDTVADRSIQIEIKRKKHSERVNRLRSRDGDELRLLARKAARWAQDHEVELAAADPPTPPQLNDRAADAWSPLLAIADVAGGDWPERTRKAAILLCGEEEAETPETELLADIRAAFEAKRNTAMTEAAMKVADRITSQELVASLLELEDRPWAEINKGRPLTKTGLAARLKPFRISPGTIRLGDGHDAPTAKGYYLKAFADVFARYLSPLPPDSPDQTVTPSHTAETQGFQADSDTSQAEWCDGLETPENLSISAECDGVTGQNTENGGTRQEIPDGIAEGRHPNGDPRPNGHVDPDAMDDIDDAIRAYAARHPQKSAAAIAGYFGQPKAVVETLLADAR